MSRTVEVGQVWFDDHVWHHCPFYVLMLSRDPSEWNPAIEEWKSAEFQVGKRAAEQGSLLGAHHRYYADEEVNLMQYVGTLTEITERYGRKEGIA